MDAAEYVAAQQECRVKLTQRLGWEKMPDEIWGYVDSLGLVYGAITGGGEDSWQELEDEARERRKILDSRVPGPVAPGRGEERGGPKEIEVHLDDYAWRRSKVFSEVVAALADRHPGIKEFRDAFLDKRFLPAHEAALFVKTQERALFFGSKKDALRFQNHDVGAPLRIHGDDLSLEVQEHALTELWELAEVLARTYFWKRLDAMWFVLTGKAPVHIPLQVTATGSGRKEGYLPKAVWVTLEADVWVDAKHVGRAFREAQRHILGGDARPLPNRTLKVVQFIAYRMRRYGEETWSERLKAWNAMCPKDWRYKSYRGLRQVFERFIHPQYNPPNPARYQTPVEAPYQKWQYRQYHDARSRRRSGT